MEETPIYVKRKTDDEVPAEPELAYVLSSNGFFICRNHRLFRSCVPAQRCPSGLAPHQPSIELRCPPVPQEQFEILVALFSVLGQRYGAEAIALILWNSGTNRVSLHVPEQIATVYKTSTGALRPKHLHYDVPLDLPPEISIIGDIHSHATGAAYASSTDELDEVHRPGIHVVVGRVDREPPTLHCEFVVDGHRFRVDPHEVVEAYVAKHSEVPALWFDRVQVRVCDTHAECPANGNTYEPLDSA